MMKIKKIIYAVLGISLGVLVYFTLLSDIPNPNIDVTTVQEQDYNSDPLPFPDNLEPNYDNDDSAQLTSSQKLFKNTYHVDQNDIRYFESVELLSYGKINPTLFIQTGSQEEPVEDDDTNTIIINPTNPDGNNKTDKPDAENPTDEDTEEGNQDGGILVGLKGFDPEKQVELLVDASAIEEVVKSQGHLPVAKKYFNITSPFGVRLDPFTKKEAYHYGIDISSEGIAGREVYSVLDGEIEFIGENNSLGNFIVISHGDFSTIYGHLEGFKKDIKAGDKVNGGDLIGYVGNTGRSTGYHLHLEFDKDGIKIDPQGFINVLLKNQTN